MAKFCGKCGSKLDEKTGLCPQCDQAKFSKKKKGKKALKAFIAIVCSVSILAAGIYGALRFLNKDKATYAYSDYNSFMEGFTDVTVTDEESAIKAVGSVADVLGITDAEKELKVVSVNNVDTDSYYRMQQYYNDIPVYGKTIVISADKNGNATALTSNYSSIAENISLKPTATQRELNQSVQQHFSDDSITFSVNDGDLVLYQTENDGLSLSYEIELLGERIIIDANSAEILLTTELYVQDMVECMYENYGQDTTFLGTKISENEYLLGNEQEGIFVFNADYKEAMKENKNEEGAIIGYSAIPKNSLSMTSTDNYFGNNDRFATEEYAKAVYALNSLQTMANYYETLNPEQNTSVAVTINNGFAPDNAYGDYHKIKDVTDATIPYQKEKIISIMFGKDLSNDIYGNLDTLGHEYTHGINHSYFKSDQDEASAIDEAYADIFGELLESQIKSEAPDWKHGDRNMVNTGEYEKAKYPYPASIDDLEKAKTFKDDNGTLWYCTTADSGTDFSHFASTIISHCAYLMWNGIDGTSQKIQQPKLGEIWYRSLMLLQDNATFSQCRNAVELSARIMVKNKELTEEQYKCVIEAFKQVGISRANYTNKNVVKNQFTLSVLSSKKTENVSFNLKIYKRNKANFDLFGIGFGIPYVGLYEVYNKNHTSGNVKLDLESGTYDFYITENSSDSETIITRVVVDKSLSDATDKFTVYTDFLDIITVILNEDPSDNKEEQNADATDAILSPESAVDIYMANKHIWMENPEYMPMQRYGYCLLDLDFDGVLELINSINDGSGRYSYNKFYKINIDKQTVEEFYPEDSQDYDGIDYYYMSHQSKLLKNKSTGNLFYLFEDYCRVSTDEGIESYAEIYMKDDILYENYIFSEYWHPDYDNNTTDMIREYTFKDSDVSESEYEQKTNAYYAENTDLNLVWECVSGIDFDEGTTSTQKQLLLDAYRSYSYDGFSYDNVETYDIIKDSVSVSFESYYYSIKDGISKGYEPKLKLESDGTFVLVENLAEGMGTYTGTYLIKENCLLLSVTHVDFNGFAGEDIKTIEFTIDDQNTLTLNNDLCLSFKGDVFSTDAF